MGPDIWKNMVGHCPPATLEVQGLRSKLQQATSVVFAVFVVAAAAVAAAVVAVFVVVFVV
jgi:hypothetical protein